MDLLESALNPKYIFFLDQENQLDVLNALVLKAQEAGAVSDAESFLESVLEREKIVSTAVGSGVAVPHAKIEDLDDFTLILGVLSRGVDWDAHDNIPVRLVFLIAGPDDRQMEYLQLLSGITKRIRSESRRTMLLRAQEPEEVIRILCMKP